MGSLIEELRRREAAARAEADRLRTRIEELSEDLARTEEQASRLSIAREEVARVLGEPTPCHLGSGSPKHLALTSAFALQIRDGSQREAKMPVKARSPRTRRATMPERRDGRPAPGMVD